MRKWAGKLSKESIPECNKKGKENESLKEKHRDLKDGYESSNIYIIVVPETEYIQPNRGNASISYNWAFLKSK